MALKTHHSGGSHSTLSEINIIPLVDVILVLLIIFMVTAPMLQQSMDIELPKAAADASGDDGDAFSLTLTKSGLVYLPGKKTNPLTVRNIGDKLVAIYANRDDKSLYIRADQDTPYGLVVDLMAAAKQAGVTKVGLVTSPDAVSTDSQNMKK